jgi:hypothetical protein
VTGSNRRPSRCKRQDTGSVDYIGEKNERGSDAQLARTEPDFRVTNESDEWADLERTRWPRLPYWQHQCRPCDDYSGFLDCMSVEEARVLFEEMFSRFHVYDGFAGFPLPPSGLPGFADYDINEDNPAAKLIAIGIRYALAVVKNERRAMHLRWQEAEEFISKAERSARHAAMVEDVERRMAEEEERVSKPQFVYFIGAPSGPVKIGIAVNPKLRLNGLQTGHHEKLELLATCHGGAEQERAYHERFWECRLKGEWFERTAEIEAEIARLSA